MPCTVFIAVHGIFYARIGNVQGTDKNHAGAWVFKNRYSGYSGDFQIYPVSKNQRD